MTNELKIFNSDVIPVYETDTGNKVVMGRELHEKLTIKTPYSEWFKRMCEYGFNEDMDYSLVSQKCETNNPKNPYTIRTDHIMSLDMAKHIAMIQRTPQGMAIRQKLIDLEKKISEKNIVVEALCNPEAVAKMLMEYSETQKKNVELTEQNKALAQRNEEMQPKEEYFDALNDVNSLMNFTDTAKALKVARKKMLDVLVKEKYLYRQGKHGKLIPYEKNNHGYFEVKEQMNAYGSWAGPQTFVTVAGRQLLLQMRDEGYFD